MAAVKEKLALAFSFLGGQHRSIALVQAGFSEGSVKRGGA